MWERERNKKKPKMSFFLFFSPGKRFWWMDEMDGWMDQEMRIDQQQLHTRCCRSRNQPVNELPWCNNYFLLFPIRRGMNRAPIRRCAVLCHVWPKQQKGSHVQKHSRHSPQQSRLVRPKPTRTDAFFLIHNTHASPSTRSTQIWSSSLFAAQNVRYQRRS